MSSLTLWRTLSEPLALSLVGDLLLGTLALGLFLLLVVWGVAGVARRWLERDERDVRERQPFRANGDGGEDLW